MSASASDAGEGPNVFAALDESPVTAFQWKIMFVSGMGFFTDAYDLFIIGIVVALLKTQWSLSTGQIALLNAVTLAASAFGAVLFGRVADLFGRKKIYGVEVLILAIGAIASALSPNFTALLIWRVVLGIGIGGDYPVSATIMSEYSGKASRGRMVGLVFAMQGAGLVIGPLLASALLWSGLSHNATWRLLLGLGAIPGLAVFYLRRRIHETPRFALAGGASEEAQAAIAQATGMSTGARKVRESRAHHQQGTWEGFLVLVQSRRMVIWLIGTASAWCLLDFCYYGNTISSPAILGLLNPNATLLHNTLVQLLIFVVFAVPGYVLAIHLLDKTGRKSIQIIGFGMMALSFLLIAAIPGVATTPGPFIVLFGISYLFTEFGPNTTTFIYPAEIFPVPVRTTGHGISAGLGKMGAFAGAYLFPHMLSAWGIRGAELVAGLVASVGLLATGWLLPEPKGRSLEELADEAYAAPFGRPFKAVT